MRLSWVAGILALAVVSSEGSAAPSCPAGYQPRGEICLGQLMSEYLACVDSTGGNKQELYDTIASTIKTVGKGDVSAKGSGFVINGGGTANIDKNTEEDIQKTLATKFFGGGPDVCLKVPDVCLKVLDKIAPAATPPIEPPKPVPTPPVTVTYRICAGEYERACQPHDVYLYCYSDVNSWARQKCSSHSVSRYNTYGGNKCGYGMDLVTCVGPK